MIVNFKTGEVVSMKDERLQFMLPLLKVSSFLLLSILFWQKTSGHYDPCRVARSVPEHALSGHVISTEEVKGLESCVITCERTEKCFSINYYSTLKRCDLNDKTVEWNLSDLKPTEGALYLTMVSRVYTPSQDCIGVCVPIPGSSVRRCVCGGNTTSLNDSCSKPLGMEDGLIKDTMIKVSSTHPESKKVWGRLHSNEGSWTPNDDYKSQWFQVNFEPEVKRITHIATQGNGKNHYWVKEYYVMYKKKGGSTLQQSMENNKLVNFTGNKNQNAVVTNKIANPFEATAVRIIPTTFYGRIALRIELYGCDIK